MFFVLLKNTGSCRHLKKEYFLVVIIHFLTISIIKKLQVQLVIHKQTQQEQKSDQYHQIFCCRKHDAS